MAKHPQNTHASVSLTRAEIDGLIKASQVGMAYLAKDPRNMRTYFSVPAQEKAAREGILSLIKARRELAEQSKANEAPVPTLLRS